MSASYSAPSEMAFFSALARYGSLSSTARELGVTTAAISKRLAAMELRLGVQLINRTTRRTSMTAEGETYLSQARLILADIEDMEQGLSRAKLSPKGLLRVNATLGFGRSHIAPLISRFVKKYPDVQVELGLTVNPPPLAIDACDVCIRFGEPPDARVISRKLAPNRRLLCAAPGYLQRAGVPKVPHDLTRHNCIGIRQGDAAYGVWQFVAGRRVDSIKIRGNLSTSDGEIAVSWALDGHGILMRAEWDIAKYLRSGRLVQILENYPTPAADIHAVYTQQHLTTGRVRVFVDFLSAHFAKSSTLAAGVVKPW